MDWTIGTILMTGKSSMTNPAFVIGNGESRKPIDVKKLMKWGKVYACNAAYRDFTPNALVAVDQPMIDEIIKFNAHYRTHFYIEDRKENQHYKNYTNVNLYKTNFPTKMDSGTFAAILASQNHNIIYMVGFDYISDNNKTNNIYKNTQNYRAENQKHVGDITIESWFHRQTILFLKYPEHQFIRVNGNNYEPPFTNDNFTNIDINDFISQYDCMKEQEPLNEYGMNYANPNLPIWYQHND